METIRIYRLKGLTSPTRQRLRAAQMEAARVWNLCRDLHVHARTQHEPWPDRDALQRATKGGQFALHSQSIQMVTHQFLANVQTTRQVRGSLPQMRYPYKTKKYRPVCWPAQTISRQGKRLLLPMGRGRKPLCFRLDLPEQIGAVSLVWRAGYELHVVVPISTMQPSASPVRATIDLGQIHLAAVTTTTGAALVVSGRGIRSLKRRHNKSLGQLQRLQARCQRGSKRWRRLQHSKDSLRGRTERQVRDLRHKATRQVVNFLSEQQVSTVFIGDPHGVRNRAAGRHHNQRMAQWEYGKDQDYLQQKCAQAGIESFTGSERGTSSQCPRCLRRQKVTGEQLGVQEPSVSLCGPSRHRWQPEYAQAGLWDPRRLSRAHHVSTSRSPARRSCRDTGLTAIPSVAWVSNLHQPPEASGSLRRQVTCTASHPGARSFRGRECHKRYNML